MIFCFIWIFCLNINYQYLTDCLLKSIMCSFFLFQYLLLLIFYMDGLVYMFCCIFICIILKINHLYLLSTSVLHTFPRLAPYRYDVILSKLCNLLSSLLLSVSFLISSIYTLCAWLLNICCEFSIISLFNRQLL